MKKTPGLRKEKRPLLKGERKENSKIHPQGNVVAPGRLDGVALAGNSQEQERPEQNLLGGCSPRKAVMTAQL